MFKNSEGYADPTAGSAMSQIMKEYRQKQKRLDIHIIHQLQAGLQLTRMQVTE